MSRTGVHVSVNAEDIAGKMWDDYRLRIRYLRTTGRINNDLYWVLIHLVNDYGMAMRLSGTQVSGGYADTLENIMQESNEKKTL